MGTSNQYSGWADVAKVLVLPSAMHAWKRKSGIQSKDLISIRKIPSPDQMCSRSVASSPVPSSVWSARTSISWYSPTSTTPIDPSVGKSQMSLPSMFIRSDDLLADGTTRERKFSPALPARHRSDSAYRWGISRRSPQCFPINLSPRLLTPH